MKRAEFEPAADMRRIGSGGGDRKRHDLGHGFKNSKAAAGTSVR
jgi:hypothetical protein